jgi:hypothetical protein
MSRFELIEEAIECLSLLSQKMDPSKLISLDPKQNHRSMEWLSGRQIERGQEQAVALKVHQREI